MMDPAEFQQTVLDALASLKTDVKGLRSDFGSLDGYVRNHLRTEMDGRLNALEANQNVIIDLLKKR